jgi:hypothetical protein
VGACVAGATALLASGCATSTRPIVEPSSQALSERKRGVAVMKFSMPQERCINQALLIGVRDGNGHRVVRKLMSRGAAPATTANAAEAELDPGEYHVLGYACQRERSFLNAGTEGGPYTPSLASFTVGPGEVVNIGHITFKKPWGSKALEMTVGDWPLSDLNRYRDERPQLFAAMKTRHVEIRRGQPLTVEEKEDRCGQLKALHASGKVQQLPKGCA